MARQCKECSCVVEYEQAKNTYDEFGFPLCEKCVKDYLNNNNTQDQQQGQATNQGTLGDPAECSYDVGENEPSATSVTVSTTSKRHIAKQTIAIQGYTREQVETIKNTVAKGASDSELQMFLYVAEKYGLDPFLKEIFYSDKMHTIIASRDGYLKAAQRDPEYEGIQSMAVCENDDFEIDVSCNTVKHAFGKGTRGKVIGAWAMCYRSNRKPVIAYASFDEYNQNNTIWNKYRSAMCCKVAESFALKRQFGISGLVTQEELGVEV